MMQGCSIVGLLKSNTGKFDYNQSLNKQVHYGHYRRGLGPHEEKKIKNFVNEIEIL